MSKSRYYNGLNYYGAEETQQPQQQKPVSSDFNLIDLLKVVGPLVNNIKTEIKSEINNIKTEVKSEINNIKTEVKAGTTKFVGDIKTELKNELNPIGEAAKKMATISLCISGGILLVSIFILIAIIRSGKR